MILVTGGGKGDRTPDLLIANQSLSHLSYTPATQIRLHPKKIKNKSFLRLWKNFSPHSGISCLTSGRKNVSAVLLQSFSSPPAPVPPALFCCYLFF